MNNTKVEMDFNRVQSRMQKKIQHLGLNQSWKTIYTKFFTELEYFADSCLVSDL